MRKFLKCLTLLAAILAGFLIPTQIASAGTIKVSFYTTTSGENIGGKILFFENDKFDLYYEPVNKSFNLSDLNSFSADSSFGVIEVVAKDHNGDASGDFTLLINQIDPTTGILTFSAEFKGKIDGNGNQKPVTITFDSLSKTILGNSADITYILTGNPYIIPLGAASVDLSGRVTGVQHVTQVPEPSFVLLLGIGVGLATFVGCRFR